MNRDDVKILSVLKQIEQESVVENLVIRGIYIWPLLKIKLCFENWSQDISSTSRSNRTIRLLKKILLPLIKIQLMKIKDFKKNDRYRKVDVLFFSDSINRRMRNKKSEYIDIFTDLIGEKLSANGISWLSLERCPSNTILAPRAHKSIWIASMLFWHRLFFRLKRKSVFEIDSKILSEINIKLKSHGMTTFSISEKEICRQVDFLLSLKNKFLKVLEKTSPKVVIQTDWYSLEMMALILACKDRGIPLVDYQHGVQGPGHIAYGAWIKPFSENSKISLFPDFFLCWSDEDVKNILSWLPSSKGSVYNVGNLYLNGFKNGSFHFNDAEEIELLRQEIGTSRTACISLQPIYGLNEAIVSQIKLLGSDYFFWIRLHPSMLNKIDAYKAEIQSKLPWLKYDIDLATKSPLPLILKESQLHITYNSSTVIEAAFMGVPSIVLDHAIGPIFYPEQIRLKQAYLGPIDLQAIEILPSPAEENLDVVGIIKEIIKRSN